MLKKKKELRASYKSVYIRTVHVCLHFGVSGESICTAKSFYLKIFQNGILEFKPNNNNKDIHA